MGRGAAKAGIIATFVVASAVSAAAETTGRPRVAMPFTCAMEQGRFVLSSATEQIYDIVDHHEQQPYTACSGAAGAQCRSWMLHRFTMQCGAVRLPWVEAVAAAAQLRPGPRVTLLDGQIVLGQLRENHARLIRACYDRLERRAGGGIVLGPRSAEDCRELQRRLSRTQVVLPAGFAPTGLIGAHLLPPSRSQPLPIAAATSQPQKAPVRSFACQSEHPAAEGGCCRAATSTRNGSGDRGT